MLPANPMAYIYICCTQITAGAALMNMLFMATVSICPAFVGQSTTLNTAAQTARTATFSQIIFYLYRMYIGVDVLGGGGMCVGVVGYMARVRIHTEHICGCVNVSAECVRFD